MYMICTWTATVPDLVVVVTAAVFTTLNGIGASSGQSIDILK